MYVVYWMPWDGCGRVACFYESPFDENSTTVFGEFGISESVWLVPGTGG